MADGSDDGCRGDDPRGDRRGRIVEANDGIAKIRIGAGPATTGGAGCGSGDELTWQLDSAGPLVVAVGRAKR